MDRPQRIFTKEPQVILSPCSSRSRTSSDSNSPEFEFWIQNPSFPQPNLVSADELFVDGALLPLHLLHHPDPDSTEPEPEPPNSQTNPEPEISPPSITMEPTTSSKSWEGTIFKKGDRKTTTAAKKQEERNKENDKKREKRSQNGASSAELNINIWPFSRGRSAGNSVTRPKLLPGALGTRKVSSAPCSRSNSAGESKSRKSWPSSPGRPGVHLSRSSPVCSFPEPVVRSCEKNEHTNGAKAKVLNTNVLVCIGYRNHLSSRSDENSAIGVNGADGSGDGATKRCCIGNGGNLFNLHRASLDMAI
ncbi:hypothetical protein POPTR_006G270100v4 [Populus trichocarpa]|uniref:Disease resistance protein RGA3 n=1 Tax=Populus trichocarpa TaxID=3694 RepID=U5G958_POPTR|nr:hypothetical protein POPTR_006G270100v4 [Populus trichocarpa]